MSTKPDPANLKELFRDSTRREELYQAQQVRGWRRRFWYVIMPMVLFWVGLFVVKVLPRLQRLLLP
jgi:hypothetical protein